MKKVLITLLLALLICASLLGLTASASAASVGDTITVDDIVYQVLTVGTPSTVGVSGVTSNAITTANIPGSVTESGTANTYIVVSILDNAFLNCDALTSITLPNAVTSIGDYAFASCDALTSITLPNAVTSIGDSAFASCDALTSITLPDAVTSIGNSAFYYCSALTSITLPDAVTSIGDYAFYYCSALTSITLPDSVTSIGDSAFAYCNNLSRIQAPNSVTSINGNIIKGSTSCILLFTGGTIDVRDGEWISKAYVTGGSISLNGLKCFDQNDGALYPVTVTIRDFSGTKQTWLGTNSLYSEMSTFNDLSYGTENMMTDNSAKLYLWLPEGTVLQGCMDNRLGLWQYTDGDSSTPNDTFTVGTTPAEIVFEPYVTGDYYPISVEIVGCPNAVGFIYKQGTTLDIDSISHTIGQKGEQYRLMIDSDVNTKGVNPLPEGYSLTGLYLNEELPTDGNYSVSDSFTTGTYSWEEGGITYGGTIYGFSMPEEAANIRAVIAYNGQVLEHSSNPAVTVNGVTMRVDDYLPSGAVSSDSLAATKPSGGYVHLYKDGNTLTLELNDASFTDGGIVLASMMGTEPSITIKLAGSSSIAGAADTNVTTGLLDLYTDQYGGTNIIFTGTGNLTATGGTGDTDVGIFGNDAITVESGVTITATGQGYGIRAGAGLTSKGNLTASGGQYGIMTTAGDISISGGTLTASGSTAALKLGGISGGDVSCSVAPVLVGADADSASVWDNSTALTSYKYVQTGVANTNAETPSITTQPVGASYTTGQTAAALTVSAYVSDSGTLSYQWYSNTVNSSSGGTEISGATSPTFTPDTSTVGTAYYYCVVTNTNTAVSGVQTASAVSNAAAVTVQMPASNPVLESIAVTTAPAKITYTVGESFDSTGMVVTATYSDGSSKAVAGYTISPNGALAATDTAVTISYTEGEVTKTAEQSITVNAKPVVLAGISITTAPAKITYTVGESFDSTGMVVTAAYSDGSSKAVAGYTISPNGALTATDTAVTISYTEGEVTKTAEQSITVNAKPVVLAGISITTAPAKITYTVGESFDSTGMVVTAAYSDGSSKAVAGYTISPNGALAATDTAVTISYTEGEVTKTAEQPITVNAQSAVMYTATVNNGTGSGEYAAGASVTITANAPETGKQFTGWTGLDGLTITSGSAATETVTFTMPAKAVTATATYGDAPVVSEPEITAPTIDQTITVYEGEQATMTITAENAEAYQWFVSYDGGKTWQKKTGATGPSYTTSAVELGNNGYQYKCRAYGSSTDNFADSPIFTLEVLEKVEIPQTGDNSQIGLWMAMCFVSLAGMVSIMMLSKKRKTE